MKLLIKSILISLLFINSLYSKDLEKVSLQLQWLDQFQFAGYYMAKEKGFYKDVGLDVEIKKYKIGVDVVDEVLNGNSQYATGRTSLIIDKSKGAKIRLMSAIFQASPLVLIAKKSSNINTINDFKNKKIMMTGTEQSASIYSMLNSRNINSHDINIIKSKSKIKSLLNGDADIISAYISNQVYILKQKEIEIEIFNPIDYGFDLYGDILFSSEKEIQNNTQRAMNFQQASIKGWEYAFSHIHETVDMILKKYNSQKKTKDALIYEANELKKLAYYKLDKNYEIGHIDINKIRRIYDIYNVMGFISNKVDIGKFIYHNDKVYNLNLTKSEKNYLQTKKEITVCVKKGWLPLEDIKDGKYIGITSDFINLYASKISLPLKIIVAEGQTESLKLFNKKKCDLKPIVGMYKKLSIPYKTTQSYLTDSIVLVTRIEQPFISDLYKIKQTILMAKGFKGYIKFIRQSYPSLNIKLVKDIDTALLLVANGKEFAYIGRTLAASYKIQERFSGQLKISNDFTKLEKGIGVVDDDPILLSILNKAINNTTEIEKKAILNKWLPVTIVEEYDYTLYWYTLLLFLSIIIVVIYFLIKQKSLTNEIEELNHNLENKINEAMTDLYEAKTLAKMGIWSFDIKKQKLEWCDETYKIFDMTRREGRSLQMKDYMSLIHLDDALHVAERYNKHLVEKESYSETYRITTRKNNFKWVETRCVTTFDINGKAILSKGTIQDITEKTLKDLQLKEKDHQMLQQGRLAQMGEMISMIAHQWRQPLNAISLTSSNLIFKCMMDDIDKELFEKELGLIDGYSQHLSQTIDDFRGFFKDDKDKSITSLKNVVNSTLKIIQTSIENKNIKIILDLICEIQFETYENELKQVVLNIIKNAEDILLEKEIQNPTITIKTLCGQDCNTKTLLIQDNAGGISSDIIDKVFDPYFSTKKEKDGTGLGLYMSKTIIEEHCGGKLTVSNEKDGAVFKIELPSI